jgi:hypothetical protein
MTPRLRLHPPPGRSPPLDAADFSGPLFPEHAFPPPPGRAEDYFAACRRGYAAMADTRVAITGLARDVGRILPLTIRRIENLARLFADSQVVVFENDSQDDTRLLLRRWAGANRRVDVTSERLDDPVNPATRCLDRAGRMAFYRQRCQERVLELCPGFDAVIIVDFDVLGGFSLDGIASSFGWPGWDFVGANGLICRRHGLAMNALRQYDTWAIRFDAALTPLSSAAAGGLVYERGGPLVPVTCCFGGLGIYRMEAFRHGRYGTTDTEHAGFHRELIRQGFGRLYLNPSQILIYGRRHRFGDPFVTALLRAWEVLGGRPEVPWIFGNDRGGSTEPIRATEAAGPLAGRRAV